MTIKNEKLYLVHIRDAINNIFDAISSRPNIFFENIHIQNAVYRYFEIIGEASKRLSLKTREENNQINWKKVSGLRDIIIHQYDGVDPNIIWKIINDDLLILQGAINKVLKDKYNLEQ